MTAQQVTLVRHATRADLAQVAALAAEHAAYEKAGPPAIDLAERLEVALFAGERPRLRCLVAELPDGVLAGYATCAPEFETWQGREYLHLDCLYLRDEHRGLGLGARLVDAVIAEAVTLGLAEVQWNTPAWNEGAIRFYDRIGATRREKMRYILQIPQH
jgi:ribosomal protein S18 acetylase RimI-like enzyme